MILYEYGVDTLSPEWSELVQKVKPIEDKVCKDRDKALEMLNNLKQTNPDVLNLALQIYSTFNCELELPDNVVYPAMIATLILENGKCPIKPK